eukprot:GABV01002576.1.p2 GENE.GABV01002576.1~~GABV01002576.1.p2  ORF type:complete len:121 (-),score=25.23 GABV01002576.1:139-501(-)
MAEAFGEAANIMVGIDDEYKIHPEDTGRVVHLTSSDPVTPTTTLRDPDFGLSAPGALKLSRDVEYCQWIETSSTDTDEDGHKTKHIIITNNGCPTTSLVCFSTNQPPISILPGIHTPLAP